MTKKEKRDHILARLDELYGTEKEGFYHNADWQLLADSCLSIIAVFFLFLALSYLLFNPARKMLNNRKEKIKGELDEARAEYVKAHLPELKERKD